MSGGEDTSLAAFWAAWELFREPALAGAIAGGLLGYLGVYVVLRRMVFMSAALAQSAGLGVTLALAAQVYLGVSATIASPGVGAFLATALATGALLIETSPRVTRREGRLGVTYLLGSAGALIVSSRLVQEAHDIESLLFGTAVAVLGEELRALVLLAAGVTTLHVWWSRGFIQASFDADSARARGLPVRALQLVLLASIALVISLCTRVLGALPVFAFSVLPALAAIRVSVNVPRALWLAGLLGATAGFGGYVAAFVWELPVGAAQTLTASVALGACELLRPWLVRARAHARHVATHAASTGR